MEYSRLSDLTEKFSISRRTFYRHFKNDSRLLAVTFKFGNENRFREPYATNVMHEIYSEKLSK